MNETLTPFLVRSKYSLISDYIASADITHLYHQGARFGYKALAVSDPNVYGLAEAYQAAAETGIKQIVAATLKFQASPLHLQTINLLARTNQGIFNVFQAINSVQREGPLSPEYLEKILYSGDNFVFFNWNSEIKLPHDFLQFPHAFLAFLRPTDSARTAARKLAAEFGKKMIITPDIRMASIHEKNVMQFLFQSLQEKANDLAPINYTHHLLQPPLGIAALYAGFPAGLLSKTVEISDDISAKLNLPTGIKAKLPEFWHQETKTYLIERMKKNLKERWHDPQTYQRIQNEMELAEQFDFLEDFVIFTQIIDYCNTHDIGYEVSGSGSHSMIAYGLGISHEDPSDLYMEAFLNRERKDLPDLDLLVPADRQEEVQRFFMSLYNEDAVKMSIVSTYDKAGIRQLAKKHQIELNPDLEKQLLQAKLPHSFITKHNSGILMGKQWMPWFKGKEPLAQFTRSGVEILRLHKFDILPSLGMEKINWAVNLIHKDSISLELRYNDPESIALIKGPLIIGISYLSPHIKNLINQMSGELTFEQVVDILAAARPAAALTRQSYFAGNQDAIIFKDQYKQQIKEVEFYDPELDEIFGSFKSRYSFWRGHARTLARILGKESFLAYKYSPYFYAAVLKMMCTHPGGISFHPQAYINEAIRRTGPLVFPSILKLPKYPEVRSHQVTLSQQLLKWGAKKGSQKYWLDNYSYELLHGHEWGKSEILEYELSHFGLAFSDNPIYRFDQSYHFNPNNSEQTIIGLPISKRTIETRRGELHTLFTIDSGSNFNASLPYKSAKQKLTPVDDYGYFQLTIRPSLTRPGSWNII